MSRNIDRDTQRRLIKLNNWKNNWTNEQKIFYSAEVEKEVDKIEKMTEKALDSCYISAMGDNTDLELKEMIEVAKRANLYMQDLKMYIKESGEEYYMKIENEELMESIKDKISEQMKNRIVKSKALIELKKEFNLPGNILSNLWIEVKEEKGIRNPHTPRKFTENQKEEIIKELGKKKHVSKETLKEIEESIRKDSEKEEFLQEVGKEINNKSNEAAIDSELPYVVTEKELEEEIKEKSKLVIKSIEIDGVYGTYIKNSDGVTADGNPIKDIEMLNREKKGYLERQNTAIEATESKIKELTEHLSKLLIDKENELEKYEEIKQVFNM